MKTNERLKKKRMERGWSLSDLAKKLQVAASTYRGWENGRKIPSEALRKMAQLHGVSVADLTGDQDQKSELVKKAIYYLEEGLSLIKQSLSS